MPHTISIGFSPCPNDTFIFDALINKKIDTNGFVFEEKLEDVEKLNQWALEKKLSITKLSYGVLPLVLDDYIVLNSGSALGVGVGPLLIRNSKTNTSVEESIIAIPGEHTTAHLLFSLAYPKAYNKVFMRYDEIENFVTECKGLGVIIHENRFTYHTKGLIKITDLGEYWEQTTNNPIPLGAIVVDRRLSDDIQKKIDELIKQSIDFAFSNYPELPAFVKNNAQEMSGEIMLKHIDLYVNEYSRSLGITGKNAVKKMIGISDTLHKRKKNNLPVFV
ncbi:MAG: 1,4-dihydroxy-6-naphthoate synthase [Ferruginibacter sp.]